jgi:hypothetical protein
LTVTSSETGGLFGSVPPEPPCFPVILPVDALAAALGSRNPDRFRAAVADAVARGGAELDGELVGLTAETAARLGLESDDGHWFIGNVRDDEPADDPDGLRWRGSRRKGNAADAWVREQRLKKLAELLRPFLRKPRPRRKPARKAKAARPAVNSFDLAVLRATLGA